MDITVKQEPCPVEEVVNHSAWNTGQVFKLSETVKQETENIFVTTDTNHAATLHLGQNEKSHQVKLENVSEETQLSELDRSKTMPNKVLIPRVYSCHPRVYNILRHSRKYTKKKQQAPQVPGCDRSSPSIPKAPSVFLQVCRKDKPMVLPTVFSHKQAKKHLSHTKDAHTNVISQIPVGTATMFCVNQQQNSLPQHTSLSRPVQHNTNEQLQMGSPLIMPANQLHNIAQQNPVFMRKLSQETTSQQLPLTTPMYIATNQIQNLSQQNLTQQNTGHQNISQQTSTRVGSYVVSGTEQQNMLQQNNIIFQNANQAIQPSSIVSSKSIFVSGTGLALQPVVLPAVLPQPITNNISGFIIPTSRAYIPSPTLLTMPSNPQVIQSLSVMPSVPLVNSVPFCQPVPVMVQNTQNGAFIGNQTTSPDLPLSQKHIVGIPVVTGNSVDNVSSCFKSNLNPSRISVSGASHTNENQTQVIWSVEGSQGVQALNTSPQSSNHLNTNNQSGNQSCSQASNQVFDQAPSTRAVDDDRANASHVPRVMFLQNANQSSNHVLNISPSVPYIEILPSGQQIIRNLNPEDMTYRSGLLFQLLPYDKQNTPITTNSTICSKQNHLINNVIKMQTSTVDSNTDEGLMPGHKIPSLGSAITELRSMLYDPEKGIHQGIWRNTCLKEQQPLIGHFNKTFSVLKDKEASIILCKMEKNTVTNVELNTTQRSSQSQSINCLATIEGVTLTNRPKFFAQNMLIKQEKIEDALKSVRTMPELTKAKHEEIDEASASVRTMPVLTKAVKNSHLHVDTEQKKDDLVVGTQSRQSQHVTNLGKIKDLTLSLPPLASQDQTSWSLFGQTTKSQPDQNIKGQCLAVKRTRQPCHIVNKIKMVNRNHFLKARYDKFNFFSRQLLPKPSTTEVVQKEASTTDNSNKYGLLKLFSSRLDYIHQIDTSGETNTGYPNALQKIQASTDSPVFQEAVNESCDSIEIKIDSVFSLNEDSRACFLASKSPYHNPESYICSRGHALDACFVVLEKEKRSRFLALQMKVSRLRPKRTCSKLCRALALHSMCQRCSFSPVIVQR